MGCSKLFKHYCQQWLCLLLGYLTNRFLPDKVWDLRSVGRPGGKHTKPLNDHQRFLRPWKQNIQKRRLAVLSTKMPSVRCKLTTSPTILNEKRWSGVCFKIFFGLVHHSKKDIDTQARKSTKKMTSSWRLSLKYYQIHLKPSRSSYLHWSILWRASARQWTSSMRLVALSGDVRWSPVTLWLKLRDRFFQQTSRSVVFCVPYIYSFFYMASFLPPKTRGRFSEEHHFFSNGRFADNWILKRKNFW